MDFGDDVFVGPGLGHGLNGRRFKARPKDTVYGIEMDAVILGS